MPTVTETEWRFVWKGKITAIRGRTIGDCWHIAVMNVDRFLDNYAVRQEDFSAYLRGRLSRQGGRVLKAVVTVEVPE